MAHREPGVDRAGEGLDGGSRRHGDGRGEEVERAEVPVLVAELDGAAGEDERPPERVALGRAQDPAGPDGEGAGGEPIARDVTVGEVELRAAPDGEVAREGGAGAVPDLWRHVTEVPPVKRDGGVLDECRPRAVVIPREREGHADGKRVQADVFEDVYGSRLVLDCFVYPYGGGVEVGLAAFDEVSGGKVRFFGKDAKIVGDGGSGDEPDERAVCVECEERGIWVFGGSLERHAQARVSEEKRVGARLFEEEGLEIRVVAVEAEDVVAGLCGGGLGGLEVGVDGRGGEGGGKFKLPLAVADGLAQGGDWDAECGEPGDGVAAGAGVLLGGEFGGDAVAGDGHGSAKPSPEAVTALEVGGGLGDLLAVDGEGDGGEGDGAPRRVHDGAEHGEGRAGGDALGRVRHDAGDHGGEPFVGVAAGDGHLGGHVHPRGGGAVAAEDLRERGAACGGAAPGGDDGVAAAVALDAHRHGRAASERGPDGGRHVRVRRALAELHVVGAGVACLRGLQRGGEVDERRGGGAAFLVMDLGEQPEIVKDRLGRAAPTRVKRLGRQPRPIEGLRPQFALVGDIRPLAEGGGMAEPLHAGRARDGHAPGRGAVAVLVADNLVVEMCLVPVLGEARQLSDEVVRPLRQGGAGEHKCQEGK